MVDAEAFKRSCADSYESGLVGALLGDTLHPGGLRLTDRLADLAGITAKDRVVDVASGRGTTGIHLARTRGCRVVGIEYSRGLVAQAIDASTAARAPGVTFLEGDAEHLPLDDGSADVILCECSLCLFPDKRQAVHEMRRVLAPSGRLAIADIVLDPDRLPEAWRGWLARVACLAEARSLAQCQALLASAGFDSITGEPHPQVLRELVTGLQSRFALHDAISSGRRPGVADGRLWTEILKRIDQGEINYALIVARRP